MRRQFFAGTVAGLALVTIPGVADAQESSSARARLEAAAQASLGGPQSAAAQIEEDRLRRLEDSRWPELDALFDPFEDAKERFAEDTGLSIALDYQLFLQGSTSSVTGTDHGAAGHARLIGNWTLVDRGGSSPGSLVFIVENRHKIGGGTTPAGLAGNIGYLGVTGTTFGDTGNSLTVLNWAQSIGDGRGGIVAGRIDPSDYTDILGYVNPRTTFSNFSILFNPVIPVPDPGFGAGGGVFLTDQIYTLGVISDANGSLTDVEWFPGGAEFYKYAEIGWTPARDQRYLTNVHIGGFHVDNRKDAGVGESYGLMLSGNITFDNELMLFGRIGISDGPAPIAEAAGSVGLMWRPGLYDDLFGIALNIADPVLAGLDTQATLEAFYRLDVSDNLAVTADAQWLVNPGFNGDDPLVLGLRARLNM